MNDPLVTIGIPFYNCKNMLLVAIKSIFAQTFQDWELILVDDGSSDGSLEIARSIDDRRVRVFSDGQNRKLPTRLNQIIELSCGKYIARMDADDICRASRIEKQLDVFQSDPDVDVLGTGIIYLDALDQPLGLHLYPSSHTEICKEPNRTFRMCHPSIIAKKSWYEKNRYDESLPVAQDFDLWLRTYKHSKFANVPEPLLYYRLDQSFNLKKQFAARYASAKFLFEYHKNAGCWRVAFTSWAAQYGKFAMTALMFATGLRRSLMARRFERISGDEREFYLDEIRKIKNTKLPLRP